jgi:large subunit ribosomal protein L34e
MPSPKYRSRSMLRKKVITPGGKLASHYNRKKANKPVCASCGTLLHSCKSERLDTKSRTQRRPERPYGGHLCPRCLKLLYKSNVRGSQ